MGLGAVGIGRFPPLRSPAGRPRLLRSLVLVSKAEQRQREAAFCLGLRRRRRRMALLCWAHPDAVFHLVASLSWGRTRTPGRVSGPAALGFLVSFLKVELVD